VKRNEFIKICGILGVSLPFQTSLTSCKQEEDEIAFNFSGKVTIIGAGAGGLSAGYLLKQKGIDFEILEASSVYGGRMRIDKDFTDFPIPLGAEWIETSTSIFKEIVNDNGVQVDVQTIPNAPDQKFVNSSWFNFFEKYIVPSVADKIKYNTVVQSIDYSGDKTVVKTATGQYTSDKVIVSVPLKILQDGDIQFTPNLPASKQAAIKDTTIWEGFKAFFEFSNKFYKEEHVFNITPSTDGEKIYYNAAHGQNTSKHILGLFVVGKPALDFTSKSGDVLKDYILQELDGIYSNQATTNYVKHITQDWDNEPFIKAGYMTDNADWKTVKVLGEAVGNKLFFAGGAYTDGEDWVSVHTAAQSAKKAIQGLGK